MHWKYSHVLLYYLDQTNADRGLDSSVTSKLKHDPVRCKWYHGKKILKDTTERFKLAQGGQKEQGPLGENQDQSNLSKTI